jgi:hypothetical protein
MSGDKRASFVLEEQGADKPCGTVVGEDAGDIGASLDFGIDAFELVRSRNLHTITVLERIDARKMALAAPPHFSLKHAGGFAASPGSCRIIAGHL